MSKADGLVAGQFLGTQRRVHGAVEDQPADVVRKQRSIGGAQAGPVGVSEIVQSNTYGSRAPAAKGTTYCSAAAVWWRISRHLTPTVAAQADTLNTFTTVLSTRLAELIGADRADSLQSSRWWPALVTAVDNALQRGWRLDDLLGAAGMPDAGSVDAAQALVWRISLLADPMPTDEDPGEPLFSAAPPDLRPNTEPPSVETAFGARDDTTARPAGTAERCLAARRIGTGWSRT